MYDIFIEELYIKPKSETKWETELGLDPLFDCKTANADILKSTKDTKELARIHGKSAHFAKCSQLFKKSFKAKILYH